MVTLDLLFGIKVCTSLLGFLFFSFFFPFSYEPHFLLSISSWDGREGDKRGSRNKRGGKGGEEMPNINSENKIDKIAKDEYLGEADFTLPYEVTPKETIKSTLCLKAEGM